MVGFWTAIFWLVPIWTFLLIPFATFFYEADDGMLMAGTAYAPNPVKKSRLRQALCYQLFTLLIVGIFFAVMYLLLSDTKIPVQEYIGKSVYTSDSGADYYVISPNLYANGTFQPFQSSLLDKEMGTWDQAWVDSVDGPVQEELVLKVSVGTFYAGLMAWLGWFLFAVFGGVGLSAVPLDLILAYKNRPRHLDAVEYSEIQMSLRTRTNELVDIGELIKIEREQKAQAGLVSRFGGWSLDSEQRKAANEEKQAILGFKQAVYLLEEDVELFLAMSANSDKANPLVPYISLVLGCCSIVISIFWFLHIIVYVFPSPPLAPFLNSYFAWFDKWFPLFGVLSIAIFTFYLLVAAVKGAFKFGVRFMFMHIHPMKVGKTYMSSFMFNMALVLMCALPVVQFSQEAFADYAAFTQIRQMFGVQVQYLQFFTYFFANDVFIYAFFGISILTALYLIKSPKDQSASAQALRDRLRAHQGGASSG